MPELDFEICAAAAVYNGGVFEEDTIMSVLKKKINNDYTCVHNAFIKDKKLSIAAKGLLLVMLSLPENWNFSIVGLQAIVPDGKDKVSSTLKILERMGYLRRSRVTNDKGVITDWEYCFSDEPVFRDDDSTDGGGSSGDESQTLPLSEKPYVKEKTEDSPLSENPSVESSAVETPRVETKDAYKILNNKILKNQVRINEDCAADAAPSAETSVEEAKAENSKPEKKTANVALFSKIICCLNEKAGTHYRANSEATRRLISARLNEGFVFEDFKAVIERKCSEWLGTDMAMYLRPQTLFGTKFEGYLNAPAFIGKKAEPKQAKTKTESRQYGTDMIDLLNAYLEE